MSVGQKKCKFTYCQSWRFEKNSVEPMEFPRRFREPMDFEQILKQMQENMMFEVLISLKSS